MIETYSEAIQLTIGAIVGLGLSVTMEKHRISLFNRETCSKALGYLAMFCMAWIVFTTILTELLAE